MTVPTNDLVPYIRDQLTRMDRHRTDIRYPERLRDCLEQRIGEYSATKKAEIKQLTGGSELYLKITSSKCRAAAALLREIFITSERPWTISATPVPEMDSSSIELAAAEARENIMRMTAAGVQLSMADIEKLTMTSFETWMRNSRDMAARQMDEATRFVDDMLVEGGFYEAMNQFIEDFVTYPIAILAGPRPVLRPKVTWVSGTPKIETVPRLTWVRVDPQNFWWSPAAIDVSEADVIERMTVPWQVLEGLQFVPGYRKDDIREALRTYGMSGFRERVGTEAEDTTNDLKGKPKFGQEYRAFDLLLYTGRITGKMLSSMRLGLPGVEPDETRSWMVSAIVCGDYLIKAQVDPDPLQRVPYYVSSYEPIPGSMIGTALPELFRDAQEAINAIGRSMLNNVALASGPQVVVDLETVEASGSSLEVRPWRVWTTAMGTRQNRPVDFYQPAMNGPELASLIGMFSSLADDVSGVPRYIGGNERVGGAGRTASGLAMLMGNSTRVMQSIAASIDINVLRPALEKLYRMLMLTVPDKSPLRGDETIVVKGATFARARESDRMRMMEWLSLTANPLDQGILGPEVRAKLLLTIARSIGIDIPEETARSLLERVDTMSRFGQVDPGAASQQPPMPGQPITAGAGMQMPPAAGLANPGVDIDTRRILSSRGVETGPLSRRG